MKAIRKQITGRTILIHNPAPFSIFHHHRQILSLRSVHVDRHRPRALSSGDENHPLPLVLSKAQKISFPIHLKIHPTPHINVILSGVAVDEADGNAPKDPYKSPQGWKEGRAASTPWMLASRTIHSAQEDRPTNSYHSQ
jgi:hypothetical protein